MRVTYTVDKNAVLNEVRRLTGYDTIRQKKKIIHHPEFVWWAGDGVFIIIVLYFLARWLKRIL